MGTFVKKYKNGGIFSMPIFQNGQLENNFFAKIQTENPTCSFKFSPAMKTVEKCESWINEQEKIA